MKPITYKLVIDGEGLIGGLELWQAGQHITLSMATKATHKNGYRWIEVKDFIDNLKLPKPSENDTDIIFRKMIYDKLEKE